jgi:uncharacterized protein YraI
MYNDILKTSTIANIVNGTPIYIEDDSNSNIFKVRAKTTEGVLSGYVDTKYIVRDDVEVKFKLLSSTSSSSSSQTLGKTTAKGGLYCRTGPGNTYPVVNTISYNTQVVITKTSNGWHKVNVIIDGFEYKDVWVVATYVSVLGSNTAAYVSKSDASVITVTNTNGERKVSLTSETLQSENSYLQYFTRYRYDSSLKLANDSYYQQLAQKYMNALGLPPKYNMTQDIQYTDDLTPGGGRVLNKTIMSNPSILSIAPGTIKMFPNLGNNKKDIMFTFAKEVAAGNQSLVNKILANESDAFSDKMYTFKSATAEYAGYLNLLCRASAIMLGIGDKTIPYTTTKLKNFDYSYWSIRKKYNYKAALASDADSSMFTNFWPGGSAGSTANSIVDAAIGDTSYINFFLNGSETSISESINTSISDSPLDQYLNVGGQLEDIINYFTGSGFNITNSDISSALESVFGSESNTVTKSMLKLGKNILKGGKLILPKMLSTATYGRSISCNMRFVSPYGDPYSIFLKCIVPVCHLLAMALPKQIADNMYTYPFVVRAAQLGRFTVDLGVISNITVNRGGSDDTSWTVDSLATEWMFNWKCSINR